MFAAKSTTSPIYLPYDALFTTILHHFGIKCSNEPSESSSKPFDKSTLAKSLNQSSRAPPVHGSSGGNRSRGFPSARRARPSMFTLMDKCAPQHLHR